jgi:serine/threonine protein kinase
LQHLISVKSSTNHTVYPVRFWTIDKGTIFSMPNAGGWVTTVENLESNLFSIAKQLIEGVAFMHEQGVAHLDLKPENIIMNSSTGQLSIIDYSISRRVRSPDEMITGFAGTPGYVAPEVGHKSYSPIRADLWSCGNVLYNLSNRCQPSLRRDALVRVCIRLMSNNPLERPSMSEVVGWMSDQQARRTDDAASQKNVCEL